MLLKADTPDRNPRILVIGGGTVGDGLEGLYADPTVDLISFDVYASPDVQYVGHGHAIPIASSVFFPGRRTDRPISGAHIIDYQGAMTTPRNGSERGLRAERALTLPRDPGIGS